jgi:hypothetical protein
VLSFPFSFQTTLQHCTLYNGQNGCAIRLRLSLNFAAGTNVIQEIYEEPVQRKQTWLVPEIITFARLFEAAFLLSESIQMPENWGKWSKFEALFRHSFLASA